MTHEEMKQKTKQAFADALKELMLTKPLDKITVKDLAEKCNVNRKTFNYYFTDVYDLFQWILNTDAENMISQIDLITDMQDGIMASMDYIEANNHILKSAYNAVGRDMLNHFLYDFLIDLCRSYIDRFAEQMGVEVSEDYKRFISSFYCEAISGTMVQWIQNLKHQDKQEVASYMSSVLLTSVPAVLQSGHHVETCS